MNKLAALTLILTTLAALPVDTAQARNRPTVDDGKGLDCFLDPDADVDMDEGSTIVSCCYDDGCWICENNAGENCEWDPKYRVMIPLGDLTMKPDGIKPGETIKLKSVPKGLAADGVSAQNLAN
jgi:hypothetical protein